MLLIKATLPTENLPIRRVLARLFQSFVYNALTQQEEEISIAKDGKVFKTMNFKIIYHSNMIHINYAALDKQHETFIAQKILRDGLQLGKIHISKTALSVKEHHLEERSTIRVGGFICTNIKDSISNKKVYLEPKTTQFQAILHKNTLEKYEALFNQRYTQELKIKLVAQKPKERIFYYSKGVMIAWYGVYEIEATSEMLRMILDTGMGGNCMKGLGFVEPIKKSALEQTA